MDPIAFNYDLNANINQVSFEDQSNPCLYLGCTDSAEVWTWSLSAISDPIIPANLTWVLWKFNC